MFQFGPFERILIKVRVHYEFFELTAKRLKLGILLCPNSFFKK